MVQLSHPYMTTGKTVTLTRQTVVGKVISLIFNMLSRFVTAFLPRSKRLLISWLQSPSAVILEPPKIKSVTVSIFPNICLEVMGPNARIFSFWMLNSASFFALLFYLHQEAPLVPLPAIRMVSSAQWISESRSVCPTLCNPMDYTVHGILQARILEWVAFSSSRGSSQSRDRTQVSHIAGGFFTSWATR